MTTNPTRRPGPARRSAVSDRDPKPDVRPAKVLPSDPSPLKPEKPAKPARAPAADTKE